MAGQLLEHVLVRRITRLRLLQDREAQLLEQDRLELLGAAHEKILARQAMDLALDAIELAGVFLRELREMPLVDPHTRPLHAREHARERPLDLVVDELERVALDPLPASVSRELGQDLRLSDRPRRHRVDPDSCALFARAPRPATSSQAGHRPSRDAPAPAPSASAHPTDRAAGPPAAGPRRRSGSSQPASPNRLCTAFVSNADPARGPTGARRESRATSSQAGRERNPGRSNSPSPAT